METTAYGPYGSRRAAAGYTLHRLMREVLRFDALWEHKAQLKGYHPVNRHLCSDQTVIEFPNAQWVTPTPREETRVPQWPTRRLMEQWQGAADSHGEKCRFEHEVGEPAVGRLQGNIMPDTMARFKNTGNGVAEVR